MNGAQPSFTTKLPSLGGNEMGRCSERAAAANGGTGGREAPSNGPTGWRKFDVSRETSGAPRDATGFTDWRHSRALERLSLIVVPVLVTGIRAFSGGCQPLVDGRDEPGHETWQFSTSRTAVCRKKA